MRNADLPGTHPRRERPDWLRGLIERLNPPRVDDEQRPHLVIARGAVTRYFGPFEDKRSALLAADAEAAIWRRDFPAGRTSFTVEPLLPGHDLGD